MNSDFFFVEEPPSGGWGTTTRTDVETLEALRRGPLAGRDDIEVGIALAQLVHDELERFATDDSHRLSDEDIGLAIRALRALLGRRGIEFNLPFRNLSTFRSYWRSAGATGTGSWQARRDLLQEHFEPIHRTLQLIEDIELGSLDPLADPVSPRTGTGWPAVDEEVRELRRRFRSATTPQDYRAVGTHCVGVLEALGRTVYDPAKHLHEGETLPAPDKTKQRLSRYVEVALAGKSNEELRGLVVKAIEFAHHVKHDHTPTRREAGISADSVILLANILRRLEQEF